MLKGKVVLSENTSVPQEVQLNPKKKKYLFLKFNFLYHDQEYKCEFYIP